ncbi:hypothetical protein QE152_g34892 [Popillia japonica]|uniref:Uncharacterized protein n=1 Tax=Popillia japonica TaxID=7064 RepID=A0AAW1IT56_POPJA
MEITGFLLPVMVSFHFFAIFEILCINLASELHLVAWRPAFERLILIGNTVKPLKYELFGAVEECSEHEIVSLVQSQHDGNVASDSEKEETSTVNVTYTDAASAIDIALRFVEQHAPATPTMSCSCNAGAQLPPWESLRHFDN